MWLLSQGDWVKLLSPLDFVEEFSNTLHRMCEKYEK
jgi:hypothetical protein